ncbi:MAG TPA: DarT ssDNA thymidine ADP-ribosyltransferase family protein [Thermoanaerobaculia bacterium]|nr:DarT ssDNA thymidine ADP-ribosyltransferase family protein [Thermoanaerobaculia bacterium]
MTFTVPERPKIFHITHVDNLPAILEAGVLWSDAKRLELGLDCQVVGR